ncbi:hypothetical protein KUTeg_019578 [Tegillarca granosa]|uniref:Uncharacterized protein n=1 Tax=Tegillarca granosa TaxID=220873 RepID=A0ABQ9EH13_TEGGR|nr:hypothetical protein KUTeg_019578 [Tegillarca granosa]
MKSADMLWIVVLVALQSVSITESLSSFKPKLSDYKTHHCSRTCKENEQPRTCEYDFYLEYYYTLTQACYNCPFNVTDCYRPHCIPADGVSRGILTVNRMLPGPAIHVCEGDTVIVNVENMMEGGEGTAIHWHGVLQEGSPHMDGVSMLTQCPIHTHTRFQYNRFYDYDLPEHSIVVNDWLAEMSSTRFAGHHHAMTDHAPHSILINGHGTLREFDKKSSGSKHSMHGTHKTDDGTSQESTDSPDHSQHTDMHSQKPNTDTHSGMSHTMPSSMTHTVNSGMPHTVDSGMTHTMEMNSMHVSMPAMSHDGMNMPMSMTSIPDTSNHENDLTTTKKPDPDHSGMHGNMNTHAHTPDQKNTSSDDDDNNNSKIFTPHAIFYVTHGKRYRFRLISNGVNNCPIHFSIDNHTLTLIASDGSPFQATQVESLNIFAGERYDFIVNAYNKVGNYWIRTRGLADCGEGHKEARQTAILRYSGASDELPSESTDYKSGERKGRKLNPLNQGPGDERITVAQLNSALPNDVSLLPVPNKRFYLALDFNLVQNYRFHDPNYYPLSNMISEGHGMHGVHAHHMFTPQINHITYYKPPSPPLSQFKHVEKYFCNEDELKEDCTKELCECTHRVKVNIGEVIELILVDEGKHLNNNHPMHLHGHNFRVVAMEKLNESVSVEYVKMLDQMGMIRRKLTRAVRKDTVTVPDGGFTILRFQATNPGFWLFHCHIAFHMEMGMGMLFQVGEPEDMVKTPKNFPRCGDFTPETESHADDVPNCKPPLTSGAQQKNRQVVTMPPFSVLSFVTLLLNVKAFNVFD